jgi:tetratricopeptide (TPR) repeat protein
MENGLTQYEKEKEKIRQSYWEDMNYENCKLLCEEYKQILDKDKVLQNTNDRWFYAFYMTKYHLEKGDIKKAIEFIELSLQCESNPKEHFRSMWQLGKCLETTDKDRAVEIYNQCIMYCDQHELEDYIVNIIHSRAMLIKSIPDMLTTIILYKVPLKKAFTKSEKERKVIEESIDYAYKDLGSLYCQSGQLLQAQLVLNKITIDKLKKELQQEIDKINEC